jgi:predicted acylesterase/phospholipase RssA/CRP-like cAMP-binding protein
VPVLSALDDDLLSRLASEVTEVEIGAGDWLVRRGDPGESLFLIRSGQLEVVDEGPPETVIRLLRRGSVLGELALLTREVRSASVRARRESHLLELGRDRFEGLIAEAPTFAIGLTRAMGAQLAATRAPAAMPGPPRTIAGLALDDDSPIDEAAGLLLDCLAEHGSVARLTKEDLRGSDLLSALERAEREFDRVLLVGDATAPGEEWMDFCLREADTIFALTRGRPNRAWIQHPDALLGCELVVLGDSARPELLESLRPQEVQLIPDGSDLEPRLEVTARRLVGRSVGLVLSGGGARAFAHLGVIEELVEAGIKIDRVGAVSLGSVFGAGFAAGHSPAEISELFRAASLDVNPTGDYTIPVFSMIRGARARSLLEGWLGERRIEELHRRFFCVSCDLVGREPVVHRVGRMRDAVMASLSIPGVFPPVVTPNGRLLVDGGVLDNLPVGTMAASGEGPVIAVDVTGEIGNFRKPVRPGIERLGSPFRRYLTGSEADLPRLAETIVRTLTVGSADTAEAARRHADLVIQPDVGGVGLLDWRQLDHVKRSGRQAARRALESNPDWLSGNRDEGGSPAGELAEATRVEVRG